MKEKIFISSDRLEKFQTIYSEEMWLMIILKVTRNQSFTFSLENSFLEKPQGGRIKLTNTVTVFLELIDEKRKAKEQQLV